MSDPFDPVRALFAAQQARGAFPGGQLVVRREGRVLCEVAVGQAREAVAVTPETRFQVMSASKPFVAYAIAALEDEGRLDPAAPVARYFPEFGAHGKEAVTLLEVLTHRSGVLLDALATDVAAWPDWERVVAAMAEARPTYPRGTLAYSPAAFGWILAEVVRRVSGQPLQDFLLARLPPEVAGVRFLDPGQRDTMARSHWLGPRKLVLAGHNIAADFEQVNNEVTTVTACVPGAGLLASARELATFYDHVLAHRGAIRRYAEPATSGLERQMKVPLTLGRGFGLGSLGPHAYGWWNTRPCFGHAGGFGVVAFADPRTRAAVAIVTNGHRGVGDLVRRFAPLGSRIRKAVRATG